MSTKALLSAVAAAIEPMKTTHGVKTLGAYNGELIELGVKKAPVATPAILVNFHKDKTVAVDQVSGSRAINILIFVLSGAVGRQARAETAADLIDEIRRLVHNKFLGQTLAQPFRVADAELMLDAPLFLGYALGIEVEVYEDY